MSKSNSSNEKKENQFYLPSKENKCGIAEQNEPILLTFLIQIVFWIRVEMVNAGLQWNLNTSISIHLCFYKRKCDEHTTQRVDSQKSASIFVWLSRNQNLIKLNFAFSPYFICASYWNELEVLQIWNQNGLTKYFTFRLCWRFSLNLHFLFNKQIRLQCSRRYCEIACV